MLIMMLPLLAVGAPTEPAPDLWAMARRNASVLRLSTLFDASTVNRRLADDAGIDQAISWCRDHGVTHVYLESYRDRVTPAKKTLAHARDRFRAAGLMVSGCVTTTLIGKPSGGWTSISCYTDAGTQKELRDKFEYAASLFDEIMIDDFLFTDCQCPDCVAAKGNRSWTDYRCDLMLRLSTTHILGAARAVNPRVRIIIKYPCWHEFFQDRGYDVVRESAAYDETWVGTETRGGTTGRQWPAEPQYRAYWLMRWLLGIGGAKCGGGWYDTLGTTPPFYLEQARQTILGGARESMLFNYELLTRTGIGQQDAAALKDELPLHFELAKLIHGKPPRGILGWKPPSSPAGPDGNLQSLLGMAGFPVIAAHRFDAKAPGFVFANHALADSTYQAELRSALESGKPVLVSQAFLSGAGPQVPNLPERAIVLPNPSGPNHWQALESVPESQLNELRDRATAGLGIRFHAPARIALYLFGDDVAVIESFRDEPTQCSLEIAGWKSLKPVLRMPVEGWAGGEDLKLPPRSLIVLRRASR